MIPYVFVDMDDVVVDFNLSVAQRLDFDHPEVAAEKLDEGQQWPEVFERTITEAWRDIDPNITWWREMPEVADRFPEAPIAVRLYDALTAISEHTLFLTAFCHANTDDCVAGKVTWLKTRFGKMFDSMHLCARKHKAAMAAPGRVLIDDNLENCTDFVNAGGGAVRYCAGTATLDRIVKNVTKASARNCIIDMKPRT